MDVASRLAYSNTRLRDFDGEVFHVMIVHFGILGIGRMQAQEGGRSNGAGINI